MRRLLSLLSLSVLLTGTLSMAVPVPASAGSVIHVQTFLDGDQPQCSLRSAIRATNADTNILFCAHDGSAGTDTIVLTAGTYRLTEGGSDDTALQGDLDVTGSLVIRGAGAGRTIIDASDLNPPDRVFHVLSGGTLTLRDLTVRGGRSSSNGGGIANSGSLTLNRVIVRNNRGLVGGGIYHFSGATGLDVRNSTISSNSAFFNGGGIGVNQGLGRLENVTVSGNRADLGGGGVAVISAGMTELHSNTIARNRADADGDGDGDGGGLLVQGSGLVTVENTLVATNSDSSVGTNAPDCRIETSDLSTNRRNLIGNPQNCSFPAGTANILGVSARLGPLRDNGGPTATHALAGPSPAVNKGAGCPATDQRGAPRSRCDIGAYERVLCRGVLVNRVGTNGRETLVGTPGADGILALGGNDVVRARGGKDAVCGGPGNDLIRGQGGDDRLFGQAGNDRIDGGPGIDRCRGGPGTNRLRRCER